MKSLFYVFIVAAILMAGCSKDQLELDNEKIEDYLEEHNLTAEKTEEGLYYVITREGTGEYPTLDHKVETRYTGSLLNGLVFDRTTNNETRKFELGGNLIEGWKIGIPLLQKEGKGLLLVPSRLGYGANSVGGIPRNSVLVFDIELIDFE